MNFLLFPFMLLAAVGFILSVVVHVSALLGLPIPGGDAAWGLHIGIFVVWLPTVLVSTRTARFTNQKDFWKVALSGCPPWMRKALYLVFGYAILNFIIFIFAMKYQAGVPSAADFRGFSGHWMVFYGVAFAMLYSVRRAPQLLQDRKCVNGHSLSAVAQFCPECGVALPNASKDA